MQFTRVILSPIQPYRSPTELALDDLHSAMKRLQYYVDQIIRTRTMIGLNVEVMRTLMRRIKPLKSFHGGLGDPLNEFETVLQNHMFLRHSVDGLLDRASNLTSQVSVRRPILNPQLISY